MSTLKQTDNLLSVDRAAAKAHVPRFKVMQLIWNKVVFAAYDDEAGYMLSPAVVAELPRLCKQHFSPGGEFLANPPTIAEYRAHAVDGVGAEHMRSIQ
jgi:hypothetical protein